MLLHYLIEIVMLVFIFIALKSAIKDSKQMIIDLKKEEENEEN